MRDERRDESARDFMRTFTLASLYAHSRRRQMAIQAHLSATQTWLPAPDWARESHLNRRRERAFVRLLIRHFARGGSVTEREWRDRPRRPGTPGDTLRDAENLATLIARRAFGFGWTVTLQK